VEPITARKAWRTLEPYHGLVYFAPEPAAAYAELGITGRDGYFASRAAPMGAVTGAVVQATFFNFHPTVVHRSIPAAWAVAGPSDLVAARFAGADLALRRAVGAALDPDAVRAALAIARRATEACEPSGRPLYAGHAALAWPDEAHLALWHAVTLLREFRGDGHVACLVDAGLDGCEALVLHAATGEVPRAVLQTSRGWSDDEWAAAVDRLAGRGLVTDDGAFTDAGRAHRAAVEARTDELALAPWRAVGDEAVEELRGLVRPMSKAIVDGGGLGGR
jgi:hypothetical protein